MCRTKLITLRWGLFLAMMISGGLFLVGCGKTEKPLKYSTVHEAAQKGDLEDVKNHLRRGAALESRNMDYYTPLFVAVKENRIEVINFLIKKGANVNVDAGIGYTPLHKAVWDGNIEIVKLLVKKEADVNAKIYGGDWGDYPIGWTPLFKAVECGYTEIIEFLIKKGANVNLKDEDGNTPLDVAFASGVWVYHPDKSELINKSPGQLKDILRLLIKAGADVDARALSLAKGDSEIIKLLRQHGVKE